MIIKRVKFSILKLKMVEVGGKSSKGGNERRKRRKGHWRDGAGEEVGGLIRSGNSLREEYLNYILNGGKMGSGERWVRPMGQNGGGRGKFSRGWVCCEEVRESRTVERNVGVGGDSSARKRGVEGGGGEDRGEDEEEEGEEGEAHRERK